MVLPREEDLPAGVTSPRSFVSSASLILSRVAPPLDRRLVRPKRSAASPSKFETGRLRIFRSSAACARTGFDLRQERPCGREERVDDRAVHVAARALEELRRDVGAGQHEPLRQLELLELLHDRRARRRRRPEPERLGVGVLDPRQLGGEVGRSRREDRRVHDLEAVRLRELRTWFGPSRPYAPLSPMSQTRLMPRLFRYFASLYAYSLAVAERM